MSHEVRWILSFGKLCVHHKRRPKWGNTSFFLNICITGYLILIIDDGNQWILCVCIQALGVYANVGTTFAPFTGTILNEDVFDWLWSLWHNFIIRTRFSNHTFIIYVQINLWVYEGIHLYRDSLIYKLLLWLNNLTVKLENELVFKKPDCTTHECQMAKPNFRVWLTDAVSKSRLLGERGSVQCWTPGIDQ